MTVLDFIQTSLAMALVYACVCRLDRLRFGTSQASAIAGQLSTLVGAMALGLSPLLDWHATGGSTIFAACTLLSVLAGLPRWRDGAPADTVKRGLRPLSMRPVTTRRGLW